MDKQLTALRLVVVVMLASLVTFGVIASIIGPRISQDPALARVLLPAAVLLAVTELTAYLVLRKITLAKVGGQLSQDISLAEAEAALFPAWQTLNLIRSAMLEGIGLFGVVIAMVTGVKAAFVVPAVAVILLLAGFPTRGRLQSLAAGMTGRNPYSG
jgi:DMSO reductase anchor subunit